MKVYVGNTTFTDQDYADDALLFTDDPSKWTGILTNFDAASQTMGLHTSWSKSHLQNTGHGTAPSMSSNASRTSAVTLAHAAALNQRCSCVLIGLASSVMGQETCMTAVETVCAPSCGYTTPLSYPLCSTVRKTGPSQNQTNRYLRLSRCRYYDGYLVYAGSTSCQTQQRSICSRIRDRRVSIFGHARRLPESAPAHESLRLVVNTRAGHRPDDRPEWKRPRGRPRQTWSASWRSMSGSLQMSLGT